jgi:LuxR family maltose regulon positive regulatory protein
MCPAGPEQAVADADLAVEAEPSWSPWRDTALGVAGEAYLLVGDVDRAIELFKEAIEAPAGHASSDNVVVSQSELALLAMDRGAWSEAEEHLGPALAAIDELQMHDYPVCLIAFACAARLAVHHGDLKEANRRLTQAMRARPASTHALPGLAVALRLQLAQVYLTLADRTTARHLLREIDDILVHRPALGVLVDRVSAFRDLLAASAQIGATGSSPLSPAELRLLPYLQTHLTIAEIAERLFVSRNTASSEVSSIYRKLGVSSRNEAVEQSTMLGLLGG